MEDNNIQQDDEIFEKVSQLMKKLKQNQELQQLADDNGLDVKNTVKLTDDNIRNVAVSVISLLLSKRDGDNRYNQLVHTGIEKRSLKTEIINTYKNQAIQLLDRYDNDLSKVV